MRVVPRRAGVVAAAVALLGAACASTTPTTGDSTTTAAPTTTTAGAMGTATTSDLVDVPDLAWERCGDGVECSVLPVPLDWADPDRGSLDIAVTRRPATDLDDRVGSLVMNPGGPSASGNDIVHAGALGLDAAITERFDLVSWDPRAINATNPVDCAAGVSEAFGQDPGPDDDAEWAALDDMARATAEECTEMDGDVLAHVGTDATVQDLEHLRRALGDEPLNYLGISYGTMIGLLYAERYPTRIRSMVLDGVVDPELDLVGTARAQAMGIERVADRMLATCTGSGCPDDSPAAAFDRLVDELAIEPLDVGDAHVGPRELMLATIVATYDPDLWGSLRRALASADAGDGTALGRLADAYAGFGAFGPYLAVLCLDLPHPTDLADFRALTDELRTAAPRLGGAVATELLACGHWDAPPWRDPAEVLAGDAPPILVIGNTGDPVTPVEQAERVARSLANGVLLIHEGEGHASTGDGCVNAVMASYLIDLVPAPDGATC